MTAPPDDSIYRITDLIFASAATGEEAEAVDLALVLGAPNTTAADPAVALYHAGLVDWILVTGKGGSRGKGRGRGAGAAVPEWQLLRDYLLAANVPEDRILVEREATNTLENVLFSAKVIEHRLGWASIRKLAICCKPVHARRALMTAQTHLPEGLSLRVLCPSDQQDVQAETWWQSEAGIARVMSEMRAIADYTRKGDLRLKPQRTRRSVHLIGIGGTGMSALAQLYLDAGWSVSGSDVVNNEAVQGLRAQGCAIADKGLPDAVDQIVRSPAIPPAHPDLVEAQARTMRVLSRSQAVTALLAEAEVISVAGSHGKSTSSAMLATILCADDAGTGFMVGAPWVGPVVRDDDLRTAQMGGARLGPARLGTGSRLVAETCEAFSGLDCWKPAHCLVTNIDDEHSDHYGGPAALTAAFEALLQRVPLGGSVVLCGDDPALAAMAAQRGEAVLTFGIGDSNRVQAEDVSFGAESSTFKVLLDGEPWGQVTLPAPGLHNLRNALGALAMAAALDIEPELACTALAGFRSVAHRWQAVARVQGVQVFEDFAHHPTEIDATLAQARRVAGDKAVHAVLQPQLISRALRLADDYAVALAQADRIWRLPLDQTGETGDARRGEQALDKAFDGLARPVIRLESVEACVASVAAHVQPGDVVVCMGPSLARRSALSLVQRLQQHPLPLHGKQQRWEPSDTIRAEHAATEPARLLGHLFDAQVARQPEAVCARDETQGWSYARMDREAERIATALRARRIGPGDLVVVTMRKSLDFIASLIGISRAGAAFVPIDPRMTRQGMVKTLRRAGARLTLTDDPWRATQAGYDAPITIAELRETSGGKETPPGPGAGTTDLAYGIFTSGSTGVPRLVGVEHRHILSFFDQTLHKVFLTEDYRLVPSIASISFDASISQLFCTLSLGGTLLLVEDLAALARSQHFAKITQLGTPPSNLVPLLEQVDLPSSLRTLYVGGEPTPQELLDQLRAIPTLQRIINLYGPAETTVAVLASQLLDHGADETDAAHGGHVIGRPFEHVRVRVVDEAGQAVSAGDAGVLLIGGPTLARGYLGAPDLTAQRFFTDPEDPGLRWYHTGDLVRQQSDGTFLFLGREDDQVKINGARIELGEVRAALRSCPGVGQAAALALSEPGRRKVLAGFVVLQTGTDLAFVRTWLQQTYPALLNPHRLIALDALPLQINGKLDRQALLVQAAASAPSDPSQPLPGSLQTQVLSIWRQYLRQPDLSLQADFREAGGDSLQALELLMAVEAAFGPLKVEMTLDSLTTPAAMIAAIEQARSEATGVGGAGASAGATPPNPAELAAEVLYRQRMFLAAWSGQKRQPDALIRTLSPRFEPAEADHGQDLFWIFQGTEEFEKLFAALRGARRLHGLRSGHKLFDYRPETIEILAEAYAAEICSLQPEGSIALGGNCQGATIARSTAFALRRRGRTLSHLLLMEVGKFWTYDQAVELIFGEASSLNPFADGASPAAALQQAYPAGYRVHFIRGHHGSFFQGANLQSFGRIVNQILGGKGPTIDAAGDGRRAFGDALRRLVKRFYRW